MTMNSHSLSKARARLSKLADEALAGEPQRITRHGKRAVVLVSEEEWQARRPVGAARSKETLADLFLRTVGQGDADDVFGERPMFKQERLLGADFAD